MRSRLRAIVCQLVWKRGAPSNWIALHDVEIGAAAGRHQALRPLGVAGEAQHLALRLEAQRIGRRARGMHHLERRDAHGADIRAASRASAPESAGRSGAGRPWSPETALPPPPRSAPARPPGRRWSAAAVRLATCWAWISHHTRPAKWSPCRCEMKIVSDGVGIEPEPVEADQRRGAAVDEEAGRGRLDVVAGLQATARAEGVAAAYNRQFHGTRLHAIVSSPQGENIIVPACLFPR